MTGPEIEKLIQLLARLPGLGPRSARRAALQLIQKKHELLIPLAEAINQAIGKVTVCDECGNIDSCNPCTICCDSRRDQTLLVVVEDVSDLWALERARTTQGLYHVLGGTLSPLNGIGPDDLSMNKLMERAAASEVKEIIIAVNATVDGQSTAYYITEHLQKLDVIVTRLAHGVPVGGELDYLDEGTLIAAFRSRSKF